ncbi:hypothetical protein DBT_2191 [Dissulfuribacter thermophilus]|uniref:Uncharacterized protein n=1 Tax=Dissulfuribacter thermophilus TaxID=1156395 RepID=A0A1B9F3G3_9BACT|nr:hypothetical protein DBT_2191 [Dissulfuribacter thermophilus]
MSSTIRKKGQESLPAPFFLLPIAFFLLPSTQNSTLSDLFLPPKKIYSLTEYFI